MTAFIVALVMGIGVGVAMALARADWLRWQADQKLRDENAHLQGEVTRLRAQVALHIGRESR